MLRRFVICLAVVVGLYAWLGSAPGYAGEKRQPNIIFILADDLGYGDLGCYGQKQVKTPNLDKLAARGVRFTQFYAGSTVCAPSRSALMQGLHTGHCTVRGNALVPLRKTDVTVAKLLKDLGYATGLIGKWGLGEPGTTGHPNLQGFDYFFGYLNQVHAHNSYPDYLWRNQEKVELPNVVENNVASRRVVHSHDLFTKEALEFIDRHKAKPFFLYLAYTIPHANNERGRVEKNGLESPTLEPYTKEAWPEVQKTFAAMVTYLDRDIGRILERLRELGLEEETIVLFSSDNGPHREGGNDPTFFQSSGPLRGIKRSLHEGGVRVPFLVAWPGRVKGGVVNDHIGAFWDFLPTAVEIAGGTPPRQTDGISFLPTLLGKEQRRHEYLYWEFFEGGFQQAVRLGKWKAVKSKLGAPLELYDLEKDLGEKENIAARYPEIVAQIEQVLRSARTDSPEFPVKAGPTKGKKK